MIISRSIIAKVQKSFPLEEQASVLEYLALYGSRKEEAEVEHVRMQLLERSGGSKAVLIQLVEHAKRDHLAFLSGNEQT